MLTFRRLTQLGLISSLILALFSPATMATSANDTEPYTYALTQATAAYQLWTTPPSVRVFKDAPTPTDTGPAQTENGSPCRLEEISCSTVVARPVEVPST